MEPVTMGLIGAGLVSAGINAWSQWHNNKTIQEREDNAVQRRVSDLQMAGLSPTLAAGQPASASNTSAPQVRDPVEIAQQIAALHQAKADISHTNAQTELAKMQATSELFHQGVMQSQKSGMDLENAWIDAMRASELGLNKANANKLQAQLGEISANTSLLKAKTAFEQTYRNYYQTLNENARINQDMLIFNRDWQLQDKMVDYVHKMSGSPLNTAMGSIGALGMLGSKAWNDVFPDSSVEEMKKGWYYPKRSR